jgi:CubicO group peptidase (beta-lactamase class C family)
MISVNRLDAAFELLERFVGEGVPGAGLVVAERGEIVGEHYTGMARPDRPAAADTLWPLASISKLYAAAACMAVIEEGRIALGTRVATIFPEFTQGGRDKITLRHLLTHTSGLPYESEQMADRLAAHLSLEALLRESYEGDLLFAPGTNQAYSDYGIGLAGLMCATVMGMSFPDLVRSRVIDPGHLLDTFMPPPEGEYHRIAHIEGPLAEGTDGAMYNSAHARNLAHPAFGTIASARDLLRFGLFFDPNREFTLFSRVATRVMITDQTGYDFPDAVTEPMSPAVRAWGIGFMLKGRMGFPELVSPATFGHPGATGCMVLVDPTYDVAFAFVSNLHLNTGYDAWTDRLMMITNVVMASMTRG